jgi:hypothetical protein
VSAVLSWTLTDVIHDVWLDHFAVGNACLPLPTPHDWGICKRTLHGGLREGVDLVEVHNGVLSYCILPTRGMGLWRGSHRGTFLGWRAAVHGPVHPRFVHPEARGGLGWLDGFDEWLCRCGLASNGPPGPDTVTDKQGRTVSKPLTLHGRIANLPAHFVEVRVNPEPPHELTVTGQVQEASLFSPHLRLTTTYTTVPGSSRLVIHDVVQNASAEPAEMQLLYHLNLGPPLLEAGSRVLAPVSEVAPVNARSAEGIDTLETFAGPTAGFAEQAYFYELAADDAGQTLVLLHTADAVRGLALRFNRRELPCFTLWRNTAAVEDGYVTGLEPGTNFPNFKSFERQQRRVPVLPPGSRWECRWSLEVYDTAAGVADIRGQIATLQSRTPRVVHRTPQARFSPS